MLIFDNTQTSATFSVVLRDKEVQNGDILSLVLVKLDDLSETTFPISNISTSADYSTFTINPSSLKQGDYKATIEIGLTFGDCIVDTPETVTVPTLFDCNPMEITSEFIVEELALFDTSDSTGQVIYITKCRVEGTAYNEVYRNDSAPQYYVYNG